MMGSGDGYGGEGGNKPPIINTLNLQSLILHDFGKNVDVAQKSQV